MGNSQNYKTPISNLIKSDGKAERERKTWRLMFFMVEQFSENSLVLVEQATLQLHLWANDAI